ncbi:MAG: hypothetical protein HONBIEJF_02125 [Fimbriimonadaceae bacterium]|nr:hypothetical protein [Fimbriimonadaceae bacterium]
MFSQGCRRMFCVVAAIGVNFCLAETNDAPWRFEVPGHAGHPTSAKLSPGGAFFATSDGNDLRIWDTSTGNLRRSLIDPGFVSAFDWSPSSKSIAVDSTSTVHSFDVASGEYGFYVNRPQNNGAEYSPDGQKILSYFEETVFILDSESGSLLKQFSYPKPVRVCRYSHSGDFIVALLFGGEFVVRRVSDGVIVRQFGPFDSVDFTLDPTDHWIASNVGTSGRLMDLVTGSVMIIDHSAAKHAFSRDGTRFVIADGKTAAIWSSDFAVPLEYCIGHSEKIRFMEFTPDDAAIITCSDDQTLRTWDSWLGTPLSTIQANVARFTVLTDSKHLVTLDAFPSGTISYWNLQSGQRSYRRNVVSKTTVVVTSSQYHIVVSADETGNCQIWDINNGTLKSWPLDSVEPLVSVDIALQSPVAAVGSEGKLRIVNLENGQVIKQVDLTNRRVDGVCFNPQTNMLAVLHRRFDAAIDVYDIGTCTLKGTWSGIDPATHRLQWSADGTRLLAFSSSSLAVWDVARKAVVGQRTVDPLLRFAAFVPDGHQVILSGDKMSGRVIVWDPESNTVTKSFSAFASDPKAHKNGCHSLAVSRDGSSVITGGTDGYARLWHYASGRLRRSLFHGQNHHHIDVVALSSNATKAATAFGGRVTVWDLQTGSVLASWSVGRKVEDLEFTDSDAALVVMSDRVRGVISVP